MNEPGTIDPPETARSRWGWLLIALIVTAVGYAPLAITFEDVLTDHPYSDYSSFQLPVREFVQSELRAGRFPYWMPHLAGGVPLHATGQVGICYPLCTPLLLALPANAALHWAVFGHALLCCAGQYRLSRLLRLSRAAAAITGIVASWGGFFTSHLATGHLAHVFAYSLVPWLLAGIVRATRQPGPASAAEFAVPLALSLLVGHPQVPYYALLLGGLWAAGAMIIGIAAQERLWVLATLTSGLLIGVLIGAAQWLPTLELVRDAAGVSARGTAEYASAYALQPRDLVRQFFPSAEGDVFSGIPELDPPNFAHEKVCYPGVLTWVLLVTGLFAAAPRSGVRGLVALIGFGILIALGDSTPFFATAGNWIPGLYWFRCTGRCLGVVMILVAVLAGAGFDALRTPAARRLRVAETLVAGGLIWSLLSAAVLLDPSDSGPTWRDWQTWAAEHLQVDLLILLALCVLSLVTISSLNLLSAELAAFVVIWLLTADLGWFNLRDLRWSEPAGRTAVPVEVLGTRDFLRFAESGRSTRDTIRYSRLVPLAVAHKLHFLGTSDGGVLPAATENLYAAVEANSEPALALAACGWTVDGSGARWTRRPAALPLTWWLPADSPLDASVPLPQLPLAASDVAALRPHARSVTPVAVGTDEWSATTAAADSGTLVIAQNYYPGWKATVDGVPAEVVPVFGTFCGVAVPAGRHSVVVRYLPGTGQLPLYLSLAGCSLLALTIWRGTRAARQSTAAVKSLA